MTRCEICGAKESDLTEVKISGAKVQACSECSDIGTTTKDSEEDNTSTKYSTGGKSDDKDTTQDTTQNSTTNNINNNSNQETKPQDPFEDLSELALNYGDLIRDERNSLGLNRQELAQDLGIKESHLESIENENTQPSVELQGKIEKRLEIDLTLEQ